VTQLTNVAANISDSSGNSAVSGGFLWSAAGAGYAGVISQAGSSPGVVRNGLLVRTGSTDSAAAALRVENGGGPILVARADGNVGIGTISPGNPLHVIAGGNETALFESSSPAETQIGVSSSSSGRRYHLVVGGTSPTAGVPTNSFGIKDYTAGFVRMVINSIGNVGIGNTGPTQRLSVGASGDGSVAIANSWTTYSDKRLKKDVSIIDNALEKISKLAGYFFYWKKGDDASRQVGVMAQDVEEIFPEVVKTGSDGIKSVDYPKLVAPMIQAIKELKAEKDRDIALLRSEKDLEIEQLKASNNAMKEVLCDMMPKARFCAE
jgi:hypothetical protein